MPTCKEKVNPRALTGCAISVQSGLSRTSGVCLLAVIQEKRWPWSDRRKQRVMIADVLPRYQVNLVRVNQTTQKGTCPLPSHSSGSKNTFFVNVAKSVWYCHSDSCKKNGNRAGGNVIDFVAAMDRCSTYEAAKRICEMFPVERNGKAEQLSETNIGPSGSNHGAPEAVPAIESGHNKPLAFTLKDINPAHPIDSRARNTCRNSPVVRRRLVPRQRQYGGADRLPALRERQPCGVCWPDDAAHIGRQSEMALREGVRCTGRLERAK